MSHSVGRPPSLDVDPDAAEKQATLATVAGALARPNHDRTSVRCPVCDRDVSDTRRPHRVPVEALEDPRLEAQELDEAPVYGWACDLCDVVLPVDPNASRKNPAVAPASSGDGWVAVEAILADGRRGTVYVPTTVISL